MLAALAGSEAIRDGLERAGLSMESRALRLLPAAMDWQWRDANTLRLGFELPPGAYATALLHALGTAVRSEEHTSELQSLMRNSYAVFCLKQKKTHKRTSHLLSILQITKHKRI